MKWNDVAEIVKHLEENYPDEEIEDIQLNYIEDMVRSLNDFEEHDAIVSRKTLKDIRDFWIEYRE